MYLQLQINKQNKFKIFNKKFPLINPMEDQLALFKIKMNNKNY